MSMNHTIQASPLIVKIRVAKTGVTIDSVFQAAHLLTDFFLSPFSFMSTRICLTESHTALLLFSISEKILSNVADSPSIT